MKFKTAGAIVLQIVLWGALSAGLARADTCPLVPSDRASGAQIEAGQWLKLGQYAKLEAWLEQQDRKNLNAEGGDLLTLRDIVQLQITSDPRQPWAAARRWVAARPDSFFSQWSAGLSYYGEAAQLHHDKPLTRLPESDQKKIQQLHAAAVEHLEKAMQLNPRSALPQNILLGIAKFQGQAAGKNAEQWLQAASRVDPKNLAARINAINFLGPIWGGSFKLMDQMAQDAEGSLSAQSLHYLRYNIVLARAGHEENNNKNKKGAYELYKQAKAMCENSTWAQDGMKRTQQ